MSLDLGPALRTAMVSDVNIFTNLGQWNGNPSVFTRRPVPGDANYPMIVVNPDVFLTDEDFINAKNPIVSKDIAVYGQQSTNPQQDQYRVVEDLGYSVRELFHRNKHSITPPTGYSVLDIVATGPIAAPTDDEKFVGRVVNL